jgi:hypothetical protein
MTNTAHQDSIKLWVNRVRSVCGDIPMVICVNKFVHQSRIEKDVTHELDGIPREKFRGIQPCYISTIDNINLDAPFRRFGELLGYLDADDSDTEKGAEVVDEKLIYDLMLMKIC